MLLSNSLFKETVSWTLPLFLIDRFPKSSKFAIVSLDEVKIEDSEKISSIYSSEDYTETRYSGNTKGTAQHLIEIANNSWQQGCEVEEKCFLPHMKTIMVNDVIMFVNHDDRRI